MKGPAGIVLGLWMAGWVLAGEATEPAATTPPGPAALAEHWVVAQQKTALLFGEEQIGELREGVRVKLVSPHGPWARVRAEFGENWIEGYVRVAALVPDTLAHVGITIGRVTREYAYEGKAVPGHEFLVIPVKLEPGPRSPTRVYFGFQDEATADLYLRYGREGKALPYGYMRPRPMSRLRYFETAEKTQTLTLTPGEPLIETYVFTVPSRARGFELILKDVAKLVRIGR